VGAMSDLSSCFRESCESPLFVLVAMSPFFRMYFSRSEPSLLVLRTGMCVRTKKNWGSLFSSRLVCLVLFMSCFFLVRGCMSEGCVLSSVSRLSMN